MVFREGSNDEKKFFATFLNIYLDPYYWSKALKINAKEWNNYIKLIRKIKKFKFFGDDES